VLDLSQGIRKLHELLKNREVTSVDLAAASLARIHEWDNDIQAFLNVTEDEAIDRAKVAAPESPTGLLDGIPFALKDNMATKGVETTCGSKILSGYIPPYSAAVTDKLEAAGGNLIGKLNMDEFAMGSSTENSGYFPTRNPWDFDVVPGGSSGGSAAAVAAGMVPYALGSDTGGSIRQPAAYCGVVGLKPTYGRVSRYGLVAFASSLDQIGPITNNVEDAAIVLQAIAGYDHRDSTSVNREVPDYTQALTGDIRGLKIGLPAEFFDVSMDEGMRKVIDEAVEKLQELGASVHAVTLPHTAYALSAYYLIAPAEASSNLARYDGVRYGVRTQGANNLLDMYNKTRSEGFGKEVKRRILIGTYALSSGYYDAYYKRAQQVRTLIRRDFETAFEQVDLILSPTAPTTAFKLGEKTSDPLTMYLSDIYTIPVNLAGLPAISVPCGFISDLPVGLQLIGKMFDEGTVLRTAHAYELATGWTSRRPQLGKGVQA
jgi:aspartyl-tRNA(Asn)/glutamyl-tRNA(Gln) amidotransferase subunit A